MRRMMLVMVSFLAALFSLKNAQAQTPSQGGDAARGNLAACLSENASLRAQAAHCPMTRASDGNICMTTLGAQLIDGRCHCLPVMRHGRMREQREVTERLANGDTVQACGTPHEYRPGEVLDRTWVRSEIHRIMDPIIAEILRRLHVVEVATATTAQRQAELQRQLADQNARLEALREALRIACAPLDVQAQPGAAAPPANTDAALIARCADHHAQLERMSQEINALTARLHAQGDELDQLAAQVRDHEARLVALEREMERRVSRRLVLVSPFLGIAGSFPIGEGQPTGYGQLGFRLTVAIARGAFSFQAQGEGGGGSGGLGATLAFGGRVGVGYRPENSIFGFAFGLSGRNFWAPWLPPAGVTGSGRGWNAGIFAAFQFHASEWVNLEPWVELGVGRSLGHTPQGQSTDVFGPYAAVGFHLVFNVNP